MNEGGIEEDSGAAPVTQISTLAGISHGIETQILKKMFDSLPPSSQVDESEILGSAVLASGWGANSLDSTDLETQRQNLPREESIESFTADQSMKIDSTTADRGLDCCCEVDVRLYLYFRPEANLDPPA